MYLEYSNKLAEIIYEIAAKKIPPYLVRGIVNGMIKLFQKSGDEVNFFTDLYYK